MDFAQLVQERRSVRSYRPDPVPDTAIERCLEAGRLAPSACNAQPWHFVVVTTDPVRSELARASVLSATGMNRFAEQAPVLVALVAERPNIASQIGGFLKNKPFYLVDVGIAAEHFCLQAAESGLGTCMLGWFDETVVRKLLRLPRGKRPVLLITMGFPVDCTIGAVSSSPSSPEPTEVPVKGASAASAEDPTSPSAESLPPPPKKRKALEKIASREVYGRPWNGGPEGHKQQNK